ncbi:MAG: hypothetical protein IAF08_13450 [Rhizobacter sp.]|nr:hypothetical protein [Chlorobiales bacterium]
MKTQRREKILQFVFVGGLTIQKPAPIFTSPESSLPDLLYTGFSLRPVPSTDSFGNEPAPTRIKRFALPNLAPRAHHLAFSVASKGFGLNIDFSIRSLRVKFPS